MVARLLEVCMSLAVVVWNMLSHNNGGALDCVHTFLVDLDKNRAFTSVQFAVHQGFCTCTEQGGANKAGHRASET